jgi:hypothetical protein
MHISGLDSGELCDLLAMMESALLLNSFSTCAGTVSAGMARGPEPAHTPLWLACRLMRILGAVIQIPVLLMFHTGQNRAHGRPVAFQFVHDDHPR